MVLLKGTRDGLLITLGQGEWRDVLADLAAQLERPRASEFFRGARARVNIGGRALTEFQLLELTGLLELHNMQLEMPTSTADAPESIAEEDEFAFDFTFPNGRGQDMVIDAGLVRRTVRSGQVVRHPGHIVIYGDVNPGGEVIAEGDVIVWGRLRGVVHAGASGDDNAVVGALLLAPTQLRIGSHIARAPDERKHAPRGAEMARVRDGRIVIESWTAR